MSSGRDMVSTVAFIDYENWYIGIEKLGLKPDESQLLELIKSKGRITEVNVFVDPSKPSLKDKRTDIRTMLTGSIIDCTNSETAKDYVDFFLLDRLYQYFINRPEIEQYILVTGDGHFSSSIAFARNYLEKTVGVIAIEDSLSQVLVKASSWNHLITRASLLPATPPVIPTSKPSSSDVETHSNVETHLTRDERYQRKKDIQDNVRSCVIHAIDFNKAHGRFSTLTKTATFVADNTEYTIELVKWAL